MKSSQRLLIGSIVFFLYAVLHQWRRTSSSSRTTTRTIPLPIEIQQLISSPQVPRPFVPPGNKGVPTQTESSISTSPSSIKVFTALPENFEVESLRSFQALVEGIDTDTGASSSPPLSLQSLAKTSKDQEKDLMNWGLNNCKPFSSETQPASTTRKTNSILGLFQELQSQRHTKHLASQVWKYCAMSHDLYSGASMTAYLDFDLFLLNPLSELFSKSDIMGVLPLQVLKPSDFRTVPNRNIAVLADGTSKNSDWMLNGSLLFLQPTSASVAMNMVEWMVNMGARALSLQPLAISKQLYHVMQGDDDGIHDNAIILKQRCHHDRFQNWNASASIESTRTGRVNSPQCPSHLEYCCDILGHVQGEIQERTIGMTKHVMMPYEVLPSLDQFPNVYDFAQGQNEADGMHSVVDGDVPFITTMRAKYLSNKDSTRKDTPNFFQIVSDKKCLPSSKACKSCMKEKRGGYGTCKKCAKYCSCFCDLLCYTHVPHKPIKSVITYSTPLYKRDSSRLIPRIIHQTWFEHLSKEKYPNFSRLAQSWKNQAGWDYRFYLDNDIEIFLSTHFPPEVKEAYDALSPGAFKADLFRYCVLFVYGGVYADVDVLLESKLDVVIENDVGFMVPLDRPGIEVNKRMCLWNGFIAAAPGHPLLASVIQNVVNNIRNRFTSVDVMQTMCPEVDFRLSHSFDVLFTTGPCILGASLNKLIGRESQRSFEPGELLVNESANISFPGKLIFLNQARGDMGAHRFTFLEKNLIIAATDMPSYDDRVTVEDGHGLKDHYSKLRKKADIYGQEGLYKDNKIANEEIRFKLGI